MLHTIIITAHLRPGWKATVDLITVVSGPFSSSNSLVMLDSNVIVNRLKRWL